MEIHTNKYWFLSLKQTTYCSLCSSLIDINLFCCSSFTFKMQCLITDYWLEERSG